MPSCKFTFLLITLWLGSHHLRAQLPGQLIIDPEHPQWLKRQGGQHVFICGPGDPENFLYLGTRNPDGTRAGDQMQRINKLIEHGGNCIYMQMVRTHGGDAKEDLTHNPFVDSDPAKGLDEDILNQWEAWFTLMDRNDILIYLYFYDDGARIWDTGDQVGPKEQAFIEAIVRKFMHHRNLIWIVGEESEERYSTKRVQAIAEVIYKADVNNHIIGDHHLSGTSFKAWQRGTALTHYSMQYNKTGEDAHAGAIEALQKAVGNYQVIYSENTAMLTDVDAMRRYAWAVAMGGLMPMLLNIDIASTPVEALNQCRYLQQFFEATDFYTMAPYDELKFAGTKYVLALPGYSYIAYADTSSQQLGIKDLSAGTYALTWMDCKTGQIHTMDQILSEAGNHSFNKPEKIGRECVVWVQRTDTEKIARKQVESPSRNIVVPEGNSQQGNSPPVVKNRNLVTPAGTEVYAQLLFDDDDGPGPYGYNITQSPRHGTLSGDNNDRYYTPKQGFTGTDQFSWKVYDGKEESKIATITITVTAPGQAPQDTGYFPPPDADGGWRQLQAAEEIRHKTGMNKEKLDEVFEFIRGSTKNGGLLVLRHGWLVYEDYFGKGHREATPNLASCGKSFTSISIGMLMEERPELFPDGLDQQVFTPTYFPPEAFPLTDPAKADIKLGQLLAFTAGIRGNNPVYVQGKEQTIEPAGPDGWYANVDSMAFGLKDAEYGGETYSTNTLWCKPGGGYSYATSSIHLASVILRHVTGMELQKYIKERLAQPLGWGRWGWGYRNAEIGHTPGGGGIALRATDMLRFGYLLLNKGRWKDRQLIPADYVQKCSHPSPYNPHFPYSLQFNVNTNGYFPELPRDAFWKRGSGGHVLYVVPSLDLVVWKLGGRDGQYSPENTGLAVHPEAVAQAESREGWKPAVDDETAALKTLQMVINAIEE